MLSNVTKFYMQNAMLHNCLIFKTLQIGKYKNTAISLFTALLDIKTGMFDWSYYCIFSTNIFSGGNFLQNIRITTYL